MEISWRLERGRERVTESRKATEEEMTGVVWAPYVAEQKIRTLI